MKTEPEHEYRQRDRRDLIGYLSQPLANAPEQPTRYAPSHCCIIDVSPAEWCLVW